MFSNNLNLCSSLNVKNIASHPYGTTGKTIDQYLFLYGVTYGFFRKDFVKLDHKNE
jgi:hypothetical protein